MALTRRGGQRINSSIWPGFVDAMTALLLVLMFVLTIFMIVQFALREVITNQDTELDSLTAEIASLADALGMAEQENRQLQAEVGALSSTLGETRETNEAQAALIASLRSDLSAREDALAEAQGTIADFEDRVASLLAE